MKTNNPIGSGNPISLTPIMVVCLSCKGENVRRDAWAEWDFENQCWTLSASFDEAWCEDCESSCLLSSKEVEIPLA